MGQKVNPIGFRVGITREWDSIWWSEKSLAKWVVEDEKIRRVIKNKFKNAEIDRVKIERTPGFLKVIIRTGKPALLIGQKGAEIEALKNQIVSVIEDKQNTKLDIKIEEVKKVNLSAQILASNVALQIERNIPFKRAMRKVMTDAMKDGAKGIKVRVSGRLAGAEIARNEWYAEGRIPTQTLRADIDYATAEALTKYGIIGVKVWLYKGEILGKKSLFGEQLPSKVDKKQSLPGSVKSKKKTDSTQTEKKEEISLKKKRTKTKKTESEKTVKEK